MDKILAAKVLMSHLSGIMDGAYKTATEIAIESLISDAMQDWYKGIAGEMTAMEYLGLTVEQFNRWVNKYPVSDKVPSNDWINAKDQLPACNVLVKVRLTNGTEAMDFVNEPVDSEVPFQHYLVSEWRMPTRDELNNFIQKAHRDCR